MIRTFAVAFSVVSIAFGAPAIGAERPVLKAAVTVSSDVVRIGDLIDNAGIVADVAVFRAPALGTTGIVSASQVAEAVRQHALVGLDTAGVDEVRVSRASRTIAADAIEAALTNALSSQYALGDVRNIALRHDRALRAMQVNATASGNIQIGQLSYEPRTGRFDAVADAGGSRLRLTGVAVVMADVVTLARNVGRGDIIKLSDVTVERRPKVEIAPDALISPDDAVGRALRSPGSAGKSLREADLGKPELVQRNELVTIIYEVPGITLTMRGKANESGAEGDVVEVVNVQSKRNVHGVVTGPGRVLVSALRSNAIVASELEKSSAERGPIIR